MTVPECVVRGKVASDHIVQFFDSDESRAECVAAFLAEGYAAGEPMNVVCRPANWVRITARLEALQVPVQRAIADGTLVVKDASDSLRRLSRNGAPDAAEFESTIGKAVEALSRRGGRVRGYGEMVDMLAVRGDLADAIKLEEMWNRLGERRPFYLMCGYSAAHFVATGTHRALREICSAHAAVQRHAQDPLATWLLDAAHNSGGGGAAN
jgi:hypothetical protein